MHWKTAPRAREKAVAERLRRSSKFYVFLWSVREGLFDEAFQDELIAAYEPRGQKPCPPAMLAMVNLLQRFDGISDADAVAEAENDKRWKLVLGTLDVDDAPFGQGTLFRVRIKACEHGLDKKLVDRTVELAKRTKMYSWKHLKVALDSSPLEGAGRVEDTWNLIGRAMSKVVAAVAKATGVDEAVVIEGADLTVLEGPSFKVPAVPAEAALHRRTATDLAHPREREAPRRSPRRTGERRGPRAYRERTVVEHRRARIDGVQGTKARYKGTRKNEFDVNRAAAVVNLQEISRLRRAA